MARPLTGRIVLRSGRFQASVPVERGSTRRHYAMFDTKKQADAWCALAVAALEAGQPLPGVVPSPDDARPAPHPAPAPAAPGAGAITEPPPAPAPALTVEQVADHWFDEVYIDGRHAGAERAKTVRSILRSRVLPFLEPILDQQAPLTRDVYRTFLADLGRTDTRVRTGPGRRAPNGLTPRTLNDVRRCLDAVLHHGVQLGAWTLAFDPAHVATPRSRRPKAPASAALTLADAATMAAHLHAVHQVTMWTCRVLTLRLGEAYGIRVRDIAPLGDGSGRALVWLHAQGGRSFTTYDGDTTTRTFHKEGLKNGYSERMQLVPAQLMALWDTVIEVFHTDPTTGTVDDDARLIPGLAGKDRGGQVAFRAALARAAQEAGVSATAVNGFELTVLGAPTPKDLRSSAVTDLEWTPGLDPTALRRFAGHAPGTDVHAVHYVKDRPANAKALAVCDALEDLLTAEVPGGLRVPTAKRCTTRAQAHLSERADELDAALADCGWLVDEIRGDADPWLTVAETATILGQAQRTIRRWAAEGRLAARAVPGGAAGHGYRIRESTVLAFGQEAMTATTLSDLAEETGSPYRRLHEWIVRFDMDWQPDGRRGVTLPDTTVNELRRLIELDHQVHVEGMTINEAALALGTTARAVSARIALGVLDEFDATGIDGSRYVTRESVDRALVDPRRMKSRPGRRLA